MVKILAEVHSSPHRRFQCFLDARFASPKTNCYKRDEVARVALETIAHNVDEILTN